MQEAMQYFSNGGQEYVRNMNYHAQDDEKSVRMEQVRNSQSSAEVGPVLAKDKVIEIYRIFEAI